MDTVLPILFTFVERDLYLRGVSGF
jgi:hypothetical protein